MIEDNIPWTEKYRPKHFDDIISHKLIKDIITKLINNNTFHHLILYGPPGIGKTTMMNSCLRYIYGEDYKLYILELNGSDDRGINIVRDEIKNYANSNNIYDKVFKLIILDEVDSMTFDAQNALKEIIETYEYNTKFCLICNFINKIIYPLQSCCIMFRLPSILKTDMKKYILKIINEEKLQYTNEGINTIIKISNGDLRKSCNTLQSVYLSCDIINKKNVYDCLGIPKQSDINIFFKNLKDKSLEKNIEYIKNLRIKNGYSLNELIYYINLKISEFDIDNNKLIEIIISLAKIEYNVSNLGTEKIQIYSLVALLYKFKEYL